MHTQEEPGHMQQRQQHELAPHTLHPNSASLSQIHIRDTPNSLSFSLSRSHTHIPYPAELHDAHYEHTPEERIKRRWYHTLALKLALFVALLTLVAVSVLSVISWTSTSTLLRYDLWSIGLDCDKIPGWQWGMTDHQFVVVPDSILLLNLVCVMIGVDSIRYSHAVC